MNAKFMKKKLLEAIQRLEGMAVQNNYIILAPEQAIQDIKPMTLVVRLTNYEEEPENGSEAQYTEQQ